MSQLGIHWMVWVAGLGDADMTTAINSTAAAGYDFIEAPLSAPSTFPVAAARKRIEAAGLGVNASLALPPEGDISSADASVRKVGEALLLDAVSAARDLGAGHLSGVLYSTLRKYGAPRTQEAVDNVVSILSRVAEKATAANLALNIEVVNRYESNIINTVADGLSLLERIGNPTVKLHLDTYHMNIEESSLGSAVDAAGDRIGYVHIGESHRGYLGTGTIDFPGFFRGLARAGYDGPIAFESFSSDVVEADMANMLGVWRNLWTDQVDLAHHARTFLTGQLEAAARTVA